eukprot:5813479-Prymnesium_polylepis.1
MSTADTSVAMDDSTGASRGSVFNRLGATMSGGGSESASGKWGHDGFEQLYGKGTARQAAGKKGVARAGVVKTIGKKPVVAKPGASTLSARFATEVYQPPKGDLRSKLSGPKKGATKKQALPEKCPW